MIPEFLDIETTHRIAWTLAHFIWQGLFVAWTAGLVLRLIRASQIRYGVAVAALALMFLAPMATFAIYGRPTPLLSALLWADGILGRIDGATRPVLVPALDGWVPALVLAWFVGVVVFSLRLASGWFATRALLRTGVPVISMRIHNLFDGLRQSLRMSRPVRLLKSTGNDGPLAIGWLRPVVLLPAVALTGLNEPQLRAVLAHELAHIRRHDFMINVLQRIVESVLFYHPAVWWLSRRVRIEREHCCDDLAVQVCGDPLVYAEALMQLESGRSAPVLAMGGRSGLSRRIRRILGFDYRGGELREALLVWALVIVLATIGAWPASSVALSPETRVISSAGFAPGSAVSSAVTELGRAVVPEARAVIAGLAGRRALPLVSPQNAGPNSPGTIQGVVTRAGTSEPVPEAQITLAGQVPSKQALDTLLRFFADRGVQFSLPANAEPDEKIIQLLTDSAAAKGVSMVNPEVRAALAAYRAANESQYSAVADASGRFSISNLPPGQYTVRARREGYFGPAGATNDPTTSQIITVAPQQTAVLTMSLLPGGTIQGRVRNHAGEPQANVNVQALALVYTNGFPVLQSVVTRATDDRGEYRLFWLPAGEYFVAATPRSPDVAAPGGEQSVVTLFPGVTDVRSAVALTLGRSEQRGGIDIDFRTEKPARITGYVNSTIPFAQPAGRGAPAGAAAAVPVVQASLVLLRRDTDIPDNTGVTANSGARSIANVRLTPSRGQFEVTGVLPGEYDLYARAGEPTPEGGAGIAFASIPVDVRGTDVENVVINLNPSVRVYGVATLDGATPPATIRVSLQPAGSAAKIPVYQGIAARAVTPAQDGSFFVPAVTSGRFRVAVQGLPSDVYIADVLQGVSVFDSGFDVGREPPQPLQVVLRSGAGKINGIVQDSSGAPLANASVVLVPSQERRQNRALFHVASTDGEGRYAMNSIAPGAYKLFAWNSVANGAFYNAGFLARYEQQGVAVMVSTMSQAAVRLSAIPNAGR